MGRRITLRRIGADTGKKAALPATMPDLLEVATTKLQLAAPAKRIFSADGDEYDADDLDLIETDDVLYVSCGEYFVPHAASIEQPPASSGAIVRVWRSMTRQCAPRNASASLQYRTSTLILRPDARVRCVIRHPFRVYGSVRIVIVIKRLLNQCSHSDLCADRVSDRPTAGAACARYVDATDRHAPGYAATLEPCRRFRNLWSLWRRLLQRSGPRIVGL